MIYVTEAKMEALTEAIKKHTKITNGLSEIIKSITTRCPLNEEEMELLKQLMIDEKSMHYYAKKYETV